MTYPLRSIIAKKDRLMKAFWAPTLWHYDDLMAGNIPPAESITDDFVHGFFAFICLLKQDRRRFAHSDKVMAVLKELGERSPERGDQVMNIFTKVNRRFFDSRLDHKAYTSVFFDTEETGKLKIHFYEAVNKVSKEDVSVTLPEKFSMAASYSLYIAGGGKLDYLDIKIEENITPNPDALAQIKLETPGEYLAIINWNSGSNRTQKFNVIEEPQGLKAVLVKRDLE